MVAFRGENIKNTVSLLNQASGMEITIALKSVLETYC